MAVKFFSAPKFKVFGKFSIEKTLIERNFQFINCTYTDKQLVCYGECQPTNVKYKYKIVYDGFHNPAVTVTAPIIVYDDDIHMYCDGNRLCLHYPDDKSWTSSHRLYNTIIPWIHEWFPLYELYQITGKWEHDFVPHRLI